MRIDHFLLEDFHLLDPDFDDNEPFIEHLRHVVATKGSIERGIDVLPAAHNDIPWHSENFPERKKPPAQPVPIWRPGEWETLERPPLPREPLPVWETPIVLDMAEYGAMLAKKIRQEAMFDEHIAKRRLELAARHEQVKAQEAAFYASLNR